MKTLIAAGKVKGTGPRGRWHYPGRPPVDQIEKGAMCEKAPSCGAWQDGDFVRCTRTAGHTGDHIAAGPTQIFSRWMNAAVEAPLE